MKRQMWLKQPRKNLSQVKSTWMLCTSEWANAVYKSLMNAAPWITPDIYMTCYYLSLELWQLYPQVVHFRKASYQIMTSDGQSLSNQQTAELMLKETQKALSLSPSQDIAPWTTTSQTTSMSQTITMMEFKLGSIKNTRQCFKITLILMIG